MTDKIPLNPVNAILIERSPRVNAESAGRIRMIYGWAQKNGYNEIWTPKKVMTS